MHWEIKKWNHSLHCGGLEPNMQYLQGMPVFTSVHRLLFYYCYFQWTKNMYLKNFSALTSNTVNFDRTHISDALLGPQ